MKQTTFISAIVTLLLLSNSLFCVDAYSQVRWEGHYKGKHWRIMGIPAGTLEIDGKVILTPRDYQTIYQYEIGNEVYFYATGNNIHDPDHYEIFNIDGERIIPYKFCWRDILQVGDAYFFVIRRYSLDSPGDLFTSKGKLLVSNYQGEVLSKYIKRITDSKYGELFLVKAKDEYNKIKQGLFTTSGDCIIPVKYKSINWTTDDDDNIAKFEVTNDNDYIGIMDRDKNWIVPLSKQFTKVTPSEISGKKYFLCMKKGYWGLYDTQFNEVIAPDFEGLEVLDEINFIKFRLNGFWGVMTLQTSTNTTKTIIPTTRGYTSIGRYIKSQKRFTYTMNGYKGECNHLGQQVSKIKVATPKPSTTIASSYGSSSSSSSKSSSSSSSSSTASSSSSSSSNNSGNKTTTVVVEHHRDPIPVQEWVQCTACWGSGTCPNCAGSGTKYIGDNLRRCWRCGGRGKCSSCSGQGGRYYTVYK
ncbi:MAG: WG repeat-containing protein [Prevotella sp.]|nr:WG repeat-containing protein [Prevotella sp.]